MTRRKTNSDVAALKRATEAILQSSSEVAARSAVNYLFDAFVVHMDKSTKDYFASKSLRSVDAAANAPATDAGGIE